MKRILIILLFALTAQAHASSCIAGPWTSEHKTFHAITTGADAAIATAITDNAYVGFAVGMAAGLAREKYKMNVGGRCEWASMSYDVVGSATGAYLMKQWKLSVHPHRHGVDVTYQSTF